MISLDKQLHLFSVFMHSISPPFEAGKTSNIEVCVPKLVSISETQHAHTKSQDLVTLDINSTCIARLTRLSFPATFPSRWLPVSLSYRIVLVRQIPSYPRKRARTVSIQPSKPDPQLRLAFERNEGFRAGGSTPMSRLGLEAPPGTLFVKCLLLRAPIVNRTTSAKLTIGVSVNATWGVKRIGGEMGW